MKNIFTILGGLNRKFLNFWNKYMAAYGSSIKDGFKSNAFAPLAWFVIFLIIPLTVLLIVLKDTNTRYIIAALLVIIVLFTLIMYVVLFRKDPKLLQSEKYRIDDKKLDIIQQKGGEIQFREVDLIPNDNIGGGTEDE